MKLISLLESLINKQYLSFNDIIQNKNLALMIHKKGNKINVICYDTSLVFSEFKSFIFKIQNKKESLDSILFSGEIQYVSNAPLGATSINLAITHPKVSGINILYPLLGLISKIYFNDGTVYSDHVTGYIPSKDAQKVWEKFFSQQYWQIEKVIPVDDKKQKLTPSTLDDGKVHYPIDDEVVSLFKDKKGIYSLLKNLKKEKKQNLIDEISESLDKINEFTNNKIFLNIENIDETIDKLKSQEDEILSEVLKRNRKSVDWIFKLKDSNDINTSNVQLLMKRSDEFIKKSIWIKSKKDFAQQIKNLADKYYIFSKEYRK